MINPDDAIFFLRGGGEDFLTGCSGTSVRFYDLEFQSAKAIVG